MPMSAFFAGASSSISAVTAGATEVKLNGVECMAAGSKGCWKSGWTVASWTTAAGAAKAAAGGSARQGALRRQMGSGARGTADYRSWGDFVPLLACGPSRQPLRLRGRDPSAPCPPARRRAPERRPRPRAADADAGVAARLLPLAAGARRAGAPAPAEARLGRRLLVPGRRAVRRTVAAPGAALGRQGRAALRGRGGVRVRVLGLAQRR